VEKIPDNKIVVNVDSWGAINSFTVESSDPEFILATIQKLKPAIPNHGPPTKKPQI
jgi:hypothetical protein